MMRMDDMGLLVFFIVGLLVAVLGSYLVLGGYSGG